MSSSDEEAGAMAAMMGFSSFASARPTKRRKTGGPTADDTPSVTKSNSIPLGKRRDLPVHPPAAPTATSGTASAQHRRAPMGLPPPTTTTNQTPRDPKADDVDSGFSDDPEPEYIDTSHAPFTRPSPSPPPTAEEAAVQRARINAVIEAGNAAYALPSKPPAAADAQLDGINHSSNRHGFRPSLIEGTAQNSGRGSGDGGYVQHPARPPRAAGGSRGGAGIHGNMNPNWYVDYYDPAFNMNPWEALERQLGLEAKGAWLARGERAG